MYSEGMDVVTIVRLDDVNGMPRAKLSGIPVPLKIGDPLGLKFRLTRQTGGRHEVLLVNGQFRVTAIGFDASTLPRRQLLTVESLGNPPTWQSVRKTPERRLLAPAVAPPTPV